MTFMVEADVAPRAYRLVGELDLATAERLTQELSPVLQTDGDVHLDVGDLEFMDSSGLRALIEISRSLSGRGHVFLNSPMVSACPSMRYPGCLSERWNSGSTRRWSRGPK